MPHKDPLKRKGLQEWSAAWHAARADANRVREMAAWVAWRCPQLWQLAGQAIERRLGVRPSPITMQGGRLVEALRLVGVMDAATAAKAMRPYAQLEAIRVAYARQAPAWGVASPLCSRLHQKEYADEVASDDEASRAGRRRARRAGVASGRG